MAVTTVAQFAAELNRPAAALLEQLKSAGVAKASTEDALTDADKERLLDHLRTAHGTGGTGERRKITLTRKSTSEIKQADSSGKARTIQVEVRKKRTFIKRDDAPSAEPAAPQVDEAELQRREDEAREQAAQLRRQEEELAEKRRLREEQELVERQAAEQRQREALEKAAAEAAAAEAALAAAKPAPRKTAAAKAAAEKAAAEKAASDKAAAEQAAAEKAAEPAKPALRVIKAADVVDEEKQRLADLAKRRKTAEDEAQAIRAMMNAPKRVLVAAKPVEEAKPVVEIKGTIHKKAGTPGTAAPGAAKPGEKKSVKSEKLSSSWADDAAKRRGLKTLNTGGASRPGWRAPRSGRRGERNDGAPASFQAPAEQQVQEVHVPETISVADLAHKMSVKAAEVIKAADEDGADGDHQPACSIRRPR